MSVKLMTLDDFQEKLRELLTEDKNLCWNITSAAIGENGSFEEYDFWDAEEFCNVWNKNFREIINGMRYGYDLDKDPPSRPGNPFADYYKWDGDTIDTTDDPTQYIYDEALDDIIDYVSENLDYDWYPDEVLELIEEYKDNGGDLEV